MKQEIKDNVYYLIDEKGKVLLKLTPCDIAGNQVVIETDTQVFAGPIELLNISN